MHPVYLLASYPKSGNTWVRAFLNNFLFAEDEPVGINTFQFTQPIIQREWVDEWLGVESADMRPELLDRYRPALMERLAGTAEGRTFVKTHEAWRVNSLGKPIFPATAIAGVILIVRDPREVVVSYAHHLDVSFDRAIEILADESFVAEEQRRGIFVKLPEFMGSWSSHTESWLNCDLPLLTVRYEDLSSRPHWWFEKILRFVGEEPDAERIELAVGYSSFAELRKQEAAEGFSERPPGANRFFRQGQTDSWRQVLSESQAQQIMRQHASMMEQLDYRA